MSNIKKILVLIFLFPLCLYGQPIKLNPTNPHYFTYKDQPAVIVTSGEHYGAVLNMDFDYQTYLSTLYAEGLNGTRLSSGANPEFQGWYNINENTWAPAPLRYACPWKRSETPGYYNGGNKFDLTQFDEEYFNRLKDFMSYAQERDIIVEFFFFTNIYTDQLWQYNPMKSSNNVNGIGNVNYNQAYDINNTQLMTVQKNLVRKIVKELNLYDNLIWEIANEPYINSQIPSSWEDEIINTIIETEAILPKKHLISQNIWNYYRDITNPNPNVSVFNYHYARERDAYLINLDLNKVIGCNETGFSQDNTQYRREVYIALMAGAGYWNNLDYSFTVGDETGQNLPPGNPAGGNPILRDQIKLAKDFIESFDFINMSPDNSIISSIASGVEYHCLVEDGKQYGIFLKNYGSWIQVNIPENDYLVEWIDTKTGAISSSELTHLGGKIILYPPSYSEDISLRIIENIDRISPTIPIGLNFVII